MHPVCKQPVVEVERLSFHYDQDDEAVLDRVSFTIDRGEVVLVLGPSGSGKSTLSFCLNGLYPEAVDGVQSGLIRIKGRPVQDYAPGELSRHVGVVFQDPESQFCMVKVEDEVAFGLENMRTPSSQIDRKIDETLDLVGLRSYRRANIHELSGGMKQKLALACMLSLQPDIVILDEPTANLDPLSTREFAQLIARLHRQHAFTLLVIEHRLDEWMPIVNRALLFNSQGQHIYDGDPKDCFNRHLEQLQRHGIWLPSATRVGLEWRAKGLFDAAELPLTEKELVAGISQGEEAVEELTANIVPQKDMEEIERRAPVLTVYGLHDRHGKRQALQNIELSVYAGELLAIVGPNGAGKTTFAHILAGLRSPLKGDIALKGKPLREWKEAALRREIGFVFQNPEHQFVADTVYEEVAFSLRLQPVSAKEMDQKVQEVMELCKLTHLRYENPFSLSQGQKRRLSVATMLVGEQGILILDEPTFGQDAHTCEQLMSLLSGRVKAGQSVIMVSHDMEVVRRYADRVMVLVGGEKLFLGQPDTLWRERGDLLEKARLLPPFHVSLWQRLKEKMACH